MLRINCLGQLSVHHAGQPLGGAATQPRRLAILAILASAGERGITREKLIGLLWPDADEERTRRVLSQAIYTLRRDLGSDEAIQGSRDLRLSGDHVSSDVAEFRQAVDEGRFEQAAAVYGGPFLDGFYLPGAPEFERWMETERSALVHDFTDSLEKCAGAAEKRGDPAAAVTWWRKLAAQDPLNARVAIRLMRALAAAGDRTGAIRHAAIHQALVEEHLDLPADAEVVALAEEIRSASTVVAAPARQVDRGGASGHQPAIGTTTPATPAVHDVAVETPPLPTPALDDVQPAPTETYAGPIGYRARRALAIASIALVAASGLALFVVRGGRAAPLDAARVLVAPLENQTGDSSLDAVGLMAAEWVTQGLSRSGLVQVVDARTMLETVRDVGGHTGDAAVDMIAEQTRAGTVVSGSYYREGDSLRFHTSIAEARTGRVRHAVDVVAVPSGRPTSALEPLRQRITGALAVLLDTRLSNWAAISSQPPTFEAYAEFLLGMQSFGIDYLQAIAHFTRAATLDTTYHQARLWAAMSNANLRRYPQADSLFRLLSDDRVSLAPYDRANLDYFYAGFVRGDWEASYEGARRMVELAPAAGHALYALGLTAQISNRPREAVEVLRRIDTSQGWGKSWSLRVYNLIARSYHMLGEHEPELEWARRLRESAPNDGWTRLAEVRALAALGRTDECLRRVDDGVAFPATDATWEDFEPGDFLFQSGRELGAHGYPALARGLYERAAAWYASRPPEEQATAERRRALARVHQILERWDEARSAYEKLAAEDTVNVEHVGALGVIAVRQGRRREADSIAALLSADRRPFRFGAQRLWTARIAGAAGDREAAVALLRQARREGHSRLYLFHVEPDFASLRDFPAYRELLQPRSSSSP